MFFEIIFIFCATTITSGGNCLPGTIVKAGPHAVTSLSDGSTFQYDANGNMIQRNEAGKVTDYMYDVENRLVEVKVSGVTIAKYEYDGDGGRVKKTDFRQERIIMSELDNYL